MLGFTTIGNRKPCCRRRRLRRVVDDPCAGIGHAEPLEQIQLRRLRDLEAPRVQPVDDGNAPALDVVEVGQRGLNRMPVTARPRRRAHAVDQQIEARVERGVPCQRRGVNGYPGQAAPIERRKQRLEPLGMFVQNGNSHQVLGAGRTAIVGPSPRPAPIEKASGRDAVAIWVGCRGRASSTPTTTKARRHEGAKAALGNDRGGDKVALR